MGDKIRIGDLFGRWVVISKGEKVRSGQKWVCRCSCESRTTREVAEQSLLNGASTSCGCYLREHARERLIIDYSGKKLGKLLITKRVPFLKLKSDHVRTSWCAKCDCGNNTIVRSDYLKQHSDDAMCEECRRKHPDITGQTFGPWYVEEFIGIRTGTRKNGRSWSTTEWKCKCSVCNETTMVMTRGSLTSCTDNTMCKLCTWKASRKSDIKKQCISAVYTQSKNSLKYKKRHENKEFTLTKEDVERLIFSDCYYCGKPPDTPFSIVYKTGEVSETILRNGIDRVNSSLGYIPENTKSCCSECNYAKLDRTEEKYIKHCKRVVEFQKTKLSS